MAKSRCRPTSRVVEPLLQDAVLAFIPLKLNRENVVMKVMVIGATGYIGSAVARTFASHGHTVHGLARNPENSQALRNVGICPVEVTLNDYGRFRDLLVPYDVVVMAATVSFDDEDPLVRALIDAYRGPGRHFLLTSGTGILGIGSEDGRWDQNTFAEDDPFPFPARTLRAVRLPTEGSVAKIGGSQR